MTPKQLLKTGILTPAYRQITDKKMQMFYKNYWANIFSKYFNLVRMTGDCSSHNASKYLKILKSDYKKIQRLKSCENYVSLLKEIVATELNIGQRRKKSLSQKKNYDQGVDYFLLTIEMHLCNINERIRLPALYSLFALLKGRIWKNLSTDEKNCIKVVVRKRLQRARKIAPRWLDIVKEFEEAPESFGEDPTDDPSKKKWIAQHNRDSRVSGKILKELRGKKFSHRIDLSWFKKELNIPNRVYAHILKDKKFLKAFHLSS